jgi:hypothetical protein
MDPARFDKWRGCRLELALTPKDISAWLPPPRIRKPSGGSR